CADNLAVAVREHDDMIAGAVAVLLPLLPGFLLLVALGLALAPVVIGPAGDGHESDEGGAEGSGDERAWHGGTSSVDYGPGAAVRVLGARGQLDGVDRPPRQVVEAHAQGPRAAVHAQG